MDPEQPGTLNVNFKFEIDWVPRTVRTSSKLVPRELDRPGTRMIEIHLERARSTTKHDTFVSEREQPEQGHSGYGVIVRTPDTNPSRSVFAESLSVNSLHQVQSVLTLI